MKEIEDNEKSLWIKKRIRKNNMDNRALQNDLNKSELNITILEESINKLDNLVSTNESENDREIIKRAIKGIEQARNFFIAFSEYKKNDHDITGQERLNYIDHAAKNINYVITTLLEIKNIKNSSNTIEAIILDMQIMQGQIEETIQFLLKLNSIKSPDTSNIEKENSLKVELSNKEKEIEKLVKKLEDNNNIDKEKHEEIEQKLKETKEELKETKEEIKLFESNETTIKETINFIEKLPEEHLKELKKNLEYRITVFNCIGIFSLWITLIMFFGHLIALAYGILDKPTEAVGYLHNVFFIIFPTIVSFASYRQSNLKSKELEQVDEKLLNSNYLIASLQAIQKISQPKEANNNVLTSINKLVDSILKTKDMISEEEEKSLNASELSTILKNLTSIIKNTK